MTVTIYLVFTWDFMPCGIVLGLWKRTLWKFDNVIIRPYILILKIIQLEQLLYTRKYSSSACGRLS